ncbi:class I SAM-dependent methyltransferase [Luteolibacter soli]|uniref:Phospholipid N-methyltransferase n=1 Tax=Luteolibacter soli TaxID=3135280 RepID=A0ABU9AQ68_9BACT
MNDCTPLQERLLFLQKFLSAPLSTGSIVPSSRHLTKAMLKPINWENSRHIAELGAGTGVFTREIRRRRDPRCQVYIFERDEALRERLQVEIPDFSFHPDARDIHLLPREEDSAPLLDGIISGLPFANFPTSLRDQILDNVKAALKPDGKFIAFQYSLRLKSRLEKRFEKVSTSLVTLNVPPAFVHVCEGPRGN